MACFSPVAEYGYTMNITEKTDVCNYGVVLLKKPRPCAVGYKCRYRNRPWLPFPSPTCILCPLVQMVDLSPTS
ncbi:hypothetical protein CIPAW_09G213000 [Carya illinoinensis]|uniref:Uncharacterized protein n=1 Tax=Carya illinoinensis TaxID=32201 RepID=A0A8T1PNI7_CARIL|nr:hypothetical protein CIPAW_09G213000 [Carya illinoinensis]